jgi:large subunit ribosomal protein L28
LPFLLDLSNASNLLKLNHWYQLFDKLKSLNLVVKLKLTAKGLRIVDKKGIDTVLTEIRARGEKV